VREDVPPCFVGVEVGPVQSMFGSPINVCVTKGATGTNLICEPKGTPCNSRDLHQAETRSGSSKGAVLEQGILLVRRVAACHAVGSCSDGGHVYRAGTIAAATSKYL
jgi:hypothetical protein